MPKTLKHHQLIDLAYSLIPKDHRRAELVAPFGNTQDIIREMLKTDARAYTQTKKFAQRIAGPTLVDTLRNCWNFVKKAVHYQIDALGNQYIKTPSSVWHTRLCDCKGYSLFVRSILKNLGINSYYKFANYIPGGELTHVYVIVPRPDGSYITIDGCMPAFNEEKPAIKTLLKP